MGAVKQAAIEAEERGYAQVDGAICSSCVNSDFLKNWINENATTCECSFCEASDNDPIAAEFDDFMGVIVEGLAFDWGSPEGEGIQYITREGGWQANVKDIETLIFEGELEEFSEREDVIGAVVDSIGPFSSFVERDFYVGSEGDNYKWAWEAFKSYVVNERRYLFSLPDRSRDQYDSPREIGPSRFLFELGDVVSGRLHDAVIREIPVSREIFRIRIGAEKYNRAAELGAPPRECALQSNRMSPAGIPMFYGAFDADTALAETFTSGHDEGKAISCGVFVPSRNLRVLDLAELPPVPSVYDTAQHAVLHPLRFLHHFSRDIAQQISRDGREHIDYVPTQIVTEYFRHIFRTADGHSIDGIAYKSSKNSGAKACVLFCKNDQAVDFDSTTTDDTMLRLQKVTHS